MNFETISLQHLLHEEMGLASQVSLPDGVAIVEALRKREGSLRRLLPDKIIRRLDRGFARSATVHPDTREALYAVCRALRPSVVFETGTYWGYSTAFLAAAVRDNGSGRVHTFDLDPKAAKAGRHFPESLRQHVEFHLGQPSTESMPPVLREAVPEMFFQDSRHDCEGVSEELRVVAPEVRRAAQDLLQQGFTVRVLASQDPQQIGVAVKIGR